MGLLNLTAPTGKNNHAEYTALNAAYAVQPRYNLNMNESIRRLIRAKADKKFEKVPKSRILET